MLTYERLEYLLECHDVRSYSGRGMNGRKCLAVTTTDGQSVLHLLSQIVSGCEDVEEAEELLRSARTDAMGTETVVYWPRVRQVNAA